MREGAQHEEIGSKLLCPLYLAKNSNFIRNANEIRTAVKDYFYGPDAVPW